MNGNPKAGTLMPEPVCEFAELAIEDADLFSHGILDAEQEVLEGLDKELLAVHAGARMVARKIMGLTARNLSCTFEHAYRLMQARNPAEFASLQFEFSTQQAQAFLTQMQDLGRSIAKTVITPRT
jgi:hypothetical protein